MISLTRISRVFTVGDEQVYGLRDVDLEINTGEYVSIMGPSGSGKSTLLNMIGLLEDLNRQQITLLMVTHDPELGRRAKRQVYIIDGRIESYVINAPFPEKD